MVSTNALELHMKDNILNQIKSFYLPNRIIEAIRSIYAYPLTIVEAPMGYGKTTSVKEVLTLIQANYLWIQLFDGRTDIFWQELCLQIGRLSPVHREKLLSTGFPDDELYRHEAVRIMNEITFPTNTVLVIDDYHLITSPEIHAFLVELIQYKIPNFHIILITRNLEFARFEELVLKHYLYHINKESFEFNEQDIRNYYKQCGVQLKESEIHNLNLHTEGWISALYLLMLHYLEKGCFTNCDSIFNLIDQTIYHSLSQETKDFLMSICLFNSVTLEQASFMWQQDNTLKLLKHISEKNAFITYDSITKSYRFHSIFSTYIKEKFYHKVQTIQYQQFRRVAKWYVQTGDYLEAMHYCILAHDYDYFLEVFEIDQGHSFTNEHKLKFDDYFKQCPNDIRLQHPIALLTYAFCLSTMNDSEQYSFVCQQFLTSLELSQELDDSERNNLMGEYEMLMSLSSYNDMPKMNQCQQRVRTLMNRPLRFLDTKGGWTFGSPSVLFMFYREPGSILELVRLMQEEAMPCYYELTNGHGKGADAIIEAEMHYYQGDMVSAEIMMHKALYQSTQYGQTDILICALFLKMKIALFCGDSTSANAILSQMKKVAQEHFAYSMIHTIDLCEAYLSISLNQKERIPTWIMNGDSSSLRLYFPVVPYINMLFAQSLLLSKDYLKLLGIANELLEITSIFPNLLTQIYLYITIAIANSQLFRDEQAMKALNIALELALQDQLYLPFVENIDNLMPIISKLQKDSIYQNQLKEMIALSSEYRNSMTKQHKDQTLEQSQLTERELEIAKLAALGLTNKEIGAKLYISVNTVKTQLKSVFTKLKITSRALLKQVL